MIGLRMLASVFGTRIFQTLLGAIVLLIMADMAETSRQLVEQEKALGLLIDIYGNLTLSLAIQALPIAVLLGVFLALADLYRSKELLAFRAAGAGSIRLSLSPLAIIFILSCASAIIAALFAPPGVERATRIQIEKLGRIRAAWSPFLSHNGWFATKEGTLFHVEEVLDEGTHLLGMSRYEHAHGQMTSVALVEELRHDENSWKSKNALLWSLDTDDPSLISIHDEMPPLPGPAHFMGISRHPEALTSKALRDTIQLRKYRGQSTLAFELESHNRIAMPFLSFALALVALGLGLKHPPASHVEASAKAIAIAFVVWGIMALCRAMGLAGMLSPPLSAYLPLIFSSTAGLLLIIRWK